MNQNKQKKFLTPRLEIIEHFDSIINELDIYTEVILDELTKRKGDADIYTPQYFDIIKRKRKSDKIFKMYAKDQYSDDYEFERVEELPNPTSMNNYVNSARAKAILALKKARDVILGQYDANASRLKRDWSKMEDLDERERFRNELFAKQFCFCLEINATERVYLDDNGTTELNKILPRPFFKFCTIFVDFYLSEVEIAKLKKLVNEKNGHFEEKTILNEKTLLIHLIDKYIWTQLGLANFGNEIIRVTKAQLLSMEKVTIKAESSESTNDSDYMPSVKSLKLNGGKYFNFDTFPNIRHLYWTMNLEDGENKGEFHCQNYHTLKTLEINSNDAFLNLSNIYGKFINLECLKLIYFRTDNIQIDQLVNLKYLSLYCSPDNILSVKQLKNIECVQFIGCELEDDCFEDLSYLELIILFKVNNIKNSTFKCLTKLQYLTISECDITELDFSLNNLYLPNLRVLCLPNNNIEFLKERNFGDLKSLEVLVLSNNKIRKLDKNFFYGLDNLKYLQLTGNPLDDVEKTLADLKEPHNLINVIFN